MSSRKADFFDGVKEGVRNFITGKTTVRNTQPPPMQVMRDAGTVVGEHGVVGTHQMMQQHVEQNTMPPVQQQVRRAHDFGYGFVTGTVLPSVGMLFAARYGRGRFPQYAQQITRMQRANSLLTTWNLLNMPGQLNAQVQQQQPLAHAAATTKLHSEAEQIRQRSTTK